MPNILLVDDDLDNVLPLALALEQSGHIVIRVSSAADALSLLRQQPVQCLVTDYEMPVQDGVQLCRTVRAQAPFAALPIVMMSAAPEPRARVRYWSRFLRKPVDVAELLRVVAALAGNGQSAQAGTHPCPTHAIAHRFQYLAPQKWRPVQKSCWP